MSLIPSISTVASFTGEVIANFNYFARPIVVYKEPQQTIVTNPTNVLYGYDPLSQTTNSEITLSSVSQTFSGLVVYPFKARGNSTAIFDNKIFLEDNKTYIKVKRECSDYLNNGMKTEKLEVDGLIYNIEGTTQVANYLGLQFYYYQIKATT